MTDEELKTIINNQSITINCLFSLLVKKGTITQEEFDLERAAKVQDLQRRIVAARHKIEIVGGNRC